MTLIFVAAFTFAAAFCLLAAVCGFLTRSGLREFLERGGTKPREPAVPFLAALWNHRRAGVDADRAVSVGIAAAAVGAALGAVLGGPGAAFLCAGIAFVLVPRLWADAAAGRFQRRFENQFARAVAMFAAAAKVHPVKAALQQMGSEEMPEPTRTVFKAAAQVMGERVHEALRQTAGEFSLPQLNDLADAVRVLEEMGGGDRAGELLDAVAEDARFRRRHRMEVASLFGELRYNMLVAGAVPVALFGLFALDGGSEYRAVLVHYPWLVLVGAGVLGIGWLVAHRLMSAAAKTL